MKLGSETITNGIKIQVFPEYIPEQSDPGTGIFSFSYRVMITNDGSEWVKLISRKWIIINSEGEEEIVEGSGVVGYTPELNPGESFEYRSFCQLNSNWGTMEGSYTFILKDGSRFQAQISRFYLVSDEVLAGQRD
ncbi:MAG: Co2+/Mg2+ efflux protein ApaG [Ignavibacteria bacterium]|nr:Co2+/Mg2+ efflux protein ApaG [Ignavibacteria bacterium]